MTPTNTGRLARLAQLAALAVLAVALPVAAQPVKLGAGTYYLSPKPGDKAVPSAPLRTEAMLKRAAPTSQWYSTLIFNPKPDPIFVQPITVKATPAGLEFALPSKEVVNSVRQDVEIRYPHKDPLLIAPVAFEPGTAKLAGADDWSIDISMARRPARAPARCRPAPAHRSRRARASFEGGREDLRAVRPQRREVGADLKHRVDRAFA